MRNWGDNSKPIIINCKFIGNSVDQEGGGMMNGPGSKPFVFNCKFFSNSAGEDGGGMYNNESYSSLIVNCIFSSNSARLTGGGMYNVNESSPKVINCTFNNNSAESAGGALCNNNGYPTLVNCILWGNSAPDDQEIHNIGSSTPIVSYSNISGGYEGIGNINTDPFFADEKLHLSEGSPCIDAGENTALPLGFTIDLDANSRIIGGVVDMGAFEFLKGSK
jgi:predicted outer membrane repeat protein